MFLPVRRLRDRLPRRLRLVTDPRRLPQARGPAPMAGRDQPTGGALSGGMGRSS